MHSGHANNKGLLWACLLMSRQSMTVIKCVCESFGQGRRFNSLAWSLKAGFDEHFALFMLALCLVGFSDAGTCITCRRNLLGNVLDQSGITYAEACRKLCCLANSAHNMRTFTPQLGRAAQTGCKVLLSSIASLQSSACALCAQSLSSLGHTRELAAMMFGRFEVQP